MKSFCDSLQIYHSVILYLFIHLFLYIYLFIVDHKHNEFNVISNYFILSPQKKKEKEKKYCDILKLLVDIAN